MVADDYYYLCCVSVIKLSAMNDSVLIASWSVYAYWTEEHLVGGRHRPPARRAVADDDDDRATYCIDTLY